MELARLNDAIKTKTIEFENAMELKKPHTELLKIYKEIKELQFKKVQLEHDFEIKME